tara:strand:+ start:2347 stop:3342 length:996 start_codon:yes stop_codon:yes gene_type:complete
MPKITLQDKVFVAGSNGMVGSSIVRKFVKLGFNLSNNGGGLILPKRKDLDLLNNETVNQFFNFKKPDIVILAAAKVGGIYANSTYSGDFILENLKIQTNIIEAAWKFGTRRLLFLGSSCIYPKFAHQPISEESLLSGPLEPTNASYAIAKIAGIKLCESLRKQYGFDAISLMPTNLYGPGDNYHEKNSHVMAAFIKNFYEAKKSNTPFVNCWGTGSPYREFLHVDDLAEASIFALENWDPNSKDAPKDKYGNILTYLNVGTGKDLTIKELALKVSRALNYEGDITWDKSKADGTPKKQLDISRMKNLGWEAKINIDDGIKSTITEYKKSLI